MMDFRNDLNTLRGGSYRNYDPATIWQHVPLLGHFEQIEGTQRLARRGKDVAEVRTFLNWELCMQKDPVS